VPRERLIAGGLLGGVVGGTTAREHGVSKGLEAGAAVFLLPIAIPERLARGVFTGFTERRLRTELLAEPRAAGLPPQPRVELPTVQDVRMYMLLTRRSFSDVVADMARQAAPDARRNLFEDVVQMALDRIRTGYDRDAVMAVLRSVRSKLDPAARREFDEVLRQYGLAEAKHGAPEYSLREEDAIKLARLFRREPEYQLTEEVAAALGRFFGPEPRRIQLMMRSEPEPRSYMLLRVRSEPQYVLTDETAVLLDRPLRQEPALMYSLAPRIATRQDQQQIYATAPVTARRTAQQTATTPLQTGATTTATDAPPRETATTPPPETPPGTPPPGQPPSLPPPGTPPYIPPWMLHLPVSIALPLLAQMGLRLPPPPNPNMPLGAYLRMLRFPALGRQREVFVLI
jgi:hypothetical protein